MLLDERPEALPARGRLLPVSFGDGEDEGGFFVRAAVAGPLWCADPLPCVLLVRCRGVEEGGLALPRVDDELELTDVEDADASPCA